MILIELTIDSRTILDSVVTKLCESFMITDEIIHMYVHSRPFERVDISNAAREQILTIGFSPYVVNNMKLKVTCSTAIYPQFWWVIRNTVKVDEP